MKTEKIKLEVTFEISYEDYKDKLRSISEARYLAMCSSSSYVKPIKTKLMKPKHILYLTHKTFYE